MEKQKSSKTKKKSSSTESSRKTIAKSQKGSERDGSKQKSEKSKSTKKTQVPVPPSVKKPSNVGKFFWKCATCCCVALFRKSRAQQRKEWDNEVGMNSSSQPTAHSTQTGLSTSSNSELPVTTIDDQHFHISYEDGDDESSMDSDDLAAITIQNMTRRFFARRRANYQRQLLVLEADAHWLAIYQVVQEEKLKKLLAAQLRQQFFDQYVNDVVNTAILFIDEMSVASNSIQR